MSEIESYRRSVNEQALARLQQESDTARCFARGARTKNTKRAYHADWACFTAWCEARRLRGL